MSGAHVRVGLRVAGAGDDARLALLGRATFLESYAELLPAEDIIAHAGLQHAPETYARWLADETRCRCWLAEVEPGRAPVGYAVAAPPELPLKDISPRDLEIRRIYVLAPFQNQGLGRRLMDAVISHARHGGCRRLLLGVYSRNTRALAFYERMGFAPAGTRQFRVGAHDYFDYILGLALT